MIAGKRPDIVKAVTFIASFPKLTWLRAAKPLLPFIPLGAIPLGLMSFVLMGRKGAADIAPRLRDALRQLPAKLARHRAKLALEVDVSETISRLPQPILIIHGRKDWLLPREHVRGFLGLRPDARVVMIDGHHMILETHPEQIAGAIRSFVEQLSSGC